MATPPALSVGSFVYQSFRRGHSRVQRPTRKGQSGKQGGGTWSWSLPKDLDRQPPHVKNDGALNPDGALNQTAYSYPSSGGAERDGMINTANPIKSAKDTHRGTGGDLNRSDGSLQPDEDEGEV